MTKRVWDTEEYDAWFLKLDKLCEEVMDGMNTACYTDVPFADYYTSGLSPAQALQKCIKEWVKYDYVPRSYLKVLEEYVCQARQRLTTSSG